MGLRVTLDDTLLTNTPKGWDSAKINSKRDSAIKGLFLNYVNDLEFWGDGFDYIDGILEANYCGVITVLIETDDCEEGVWVEEFNGTIKLTEINTYDVDQRIIKTKIFDESYDAKISNNKSLKAYVDVGTSKNGVNIQAVSPVDIQLFNPTTGTAYNSYLATLRQGWRVFDCFRFIIDYMTDGGVGFKSDLLAGELYDLMLFNGKEVRIGNGGGLQLEVSFKELFQEIDKKHNISFAIEPSPTGYASLFQLRLEKSSYFEQDDDIITLDNVAGILMEFNQEDLYSDIDVGSDSFDDDIVLSYPPINFKAFKKENYTILGQCNIDKTLNLVSKYIIDTNVIEDVLVNGEDKYDKKTFLIVTDGTKALKYKEYDEPVSEGTDTSGTANKLIDATADFISDGVVAGDMAVNMLTGLRANVDSVDSLTTLSLDTDIFNSGDGYQVRDSPFSYNNPLTNIEVVNRFIGGLPNSVIKHISGSSTANFEAGMTTNVVDTSFPVTIEPVVYDDDSTPPFFDDGGNFDAVTNFDYTIPSSGLYGFKANSVFRLNGLIGSEKVSNGDFSGGETGWSIVYGGEISGGSYNYNTEEYISPLGILKQTLNINDNSIYVLEVTVEITKGYISVSGISSSGQVHLIKESGTHRLEFNVTNKYANNFIAFQNINGFGGIFDQKSGANYSISNVSIKPMPRFDITQSIVRSSATGVALQTFSNTEIYAFNKDVFQREVKLISGKTFPAFSGEKITVKINITNLDGLSTKATLLTDLTDATTGEVDYTEFKTVLVDDGGGDLLPVDSATFPIYRYKFKKAMNYADFKLLKDAPEKAILFSKSISNHLFGWRNAITYNRKTGETEFDLRSKTKINGDCEL